MRIIYKLIRSQYIGDLLISNKNILEEIQAFAFLCHVQDISRPADVYSSLYDDHHGYTDHRQALYDIW